MQIYNDCAGHLAVCTNAKKVEIFKASKFHNFARTIFYYYGKCITFD